MGKLQGREIGESMHSEFTEETGRTEERGKTSEIRLYCCCLQEEGITCHTKNNNKSSKLSEWG